jgi:hypothetical protein
MKKLLFVCLVATLAATFACNTAKPGEALRPQATLKDIMDSIVDPAADTLWEAVETVVTIDGIEEHAPHTDEEWANVRRHAVALVEASNLLLVPGRRVAKPGEKSENAKVELEPEEIEKLIKDDPATFERLAHALQDAALPAFKAVDARNAQGLSEAGEAIDTACENCHLKYWYPNGGPPSGPVLSPREIGVRPSDPGKPTPPAPQPAAPKAQQPASGRK